MRIEELEDVQNPEHPREKNKKSPVKKSAILVPSILELPTSADTSNRTLPHCPPLSLLSFYYIFYSVAPFYIPKTPSVFR